MKTAEEWVNEKEWSGNEDGDGNLLHYEWTADDIKQIQLDAMKEGMLRAHKIQQKTPPSEHWECGKAILTAAEQLTEKDL